MRRRPERRLRLALACLALALAPAAHADDAPAGALVVFGGLARTMMSPHDSETTSVDYVPVNRGTAGVRYEHPVSARVGLSIDTRWVPRGGGVSYRQTYGYFADYLQFSPRVSLRTPGTRVWGQFAVGPAVAMRLRDRYAYSIYYPDRYSHEELPGLGRMKSTEASVVAGAALVLKPGKRTRFMLEVTYDHGLTSVHSSNGDPGQDFPFDFDGRSRTLTAVVGVAIELRRQAVAQAQPAW